MEHQAACEPAAGCACNPAAADALLAAMLQARAMCVQAALTTRREACTTEEITARADAYWQWVSQPLAARAIGEADPLTRRKRRR